MLDKVNELIKKFRININQIIANSDHTEDDLYNEAFIVVYEFLDKITVNEKVFINELRKRCLNFNKYNRYITSKDRWERFNEYENEMINNCINQQDNTENLLVDLMSVKNILSSKNYDFLIYYYSNGISDTAREYKLTEKYTKVKVSRLIKQLRKELLDGE